MKRLENYPAKQIRFGADRPTWNSKKFSAEKDVGSAGSSCKYNLFINDSGCRIIKDALSLSLALLAQARLFSMSLLTFEGQKRIQRIFTACRMFLEHVWPPRDFVWELSVRREGPFLVNSGHQRVEQQQCSAVMSPGNWLNRTRGLAVRQQLAVLYVSQNWVCSLAQSVSKCPPSQHIDWPSRWHRRWKNSIFSLIDHLEEAKLLILYLQSSFDAHQNWNVFVRMCNSVQNMHNVCTYK